MKEKPEMDGGGICESCNYLVDTFAESFYIWDGDGTEKICQDCVDEWSKEREDSIFHEPC